jgi:hypothetical protein
VLRRAHAERRGGNAEQLLDLTVRFQRISAAVHSTPVVLLAGSVRRVDEPELPLFHEVVERIAHATPGTPPVKVRCETAMRWATARLKGR